MATIKQRLLKKNASGTYDTIHLETDASCITGILPVANGGTGASSLSSLASSLSASVLTSGVAIGSYVGAGGTSRTISLSFTPRFVLVASSTRPAQSQIITCTIKGYSSGFQFYAYASGIHHTISIGTNSFTLNDTCGTSTFDQNGYRYVWLAIA